MQQLFSKKTTNCFYVGFLQHNPAPLPASPTEIVGEETRATPLLFAEGRIQGRREMVAQIFPHEKHAYGDNEDKSYLTYLII